MLVDIRALTIMAGNKESGSSVSPIDPFPTKDIRRLLALGGSVSLHGTLLKGALGKEVERTRNKFLSDRQDFNPFSWAINGVIKVGLSDVFSNQRLNLRTDASDNIAWFDSGRLYVEVMQKAWQGNISSLFNDTLNLACLPDDFIKKLLKEKQGLFVSLIEPARVPSERPNSISPYYLNLFDMKAKGKEILAKKIELYNSTDRQTPESFEIANNKMKEALSNANLIGVVCR